MASLSRLEERMIELEQEVQHSKAATNLMNQFIDAGLVQQSSENEFVVHSS